MESASGTAQDRQHAQRSEETLLLHSLNNAIAVLSLELASLRRTRENAQEFQKAYDSVLQELVVLKEVVAHAARLFGSRDAAQAIVDAGRRVSSPLARNRKTPIRVLCADDSADIADGIQMIVESEPDMEFVGSLKSADSLLTEVKRLCDPSNAASSENSSDGPLVILVDAAMPGKDPLVAIAEVAMVCPQARTVVFSGYGGPEFISRAHGAGAWSCISKSEDPESLLRTIREVADLRAPIAI